MRSLLLLVIAGLMMPVPIPAAEKAAPVIHWQPWSDDVFAQARREHKFVLLDLEAVWCHWCHVMDKETYANPEVIALIDAHYLAVRVDQDARPDLSNRYEDYGWPATVVFNAERGEIAKRQGYLPPALMSAMLRAIVADPTPGPSVTNDRAPSAEGDIFASGTGKDDLRRAYLDGYDAKLGGWGFGHKFLDWDNIEYALIQGAHRDAAMAADAWQTLDAGRKLIDPVWGGADQYSIGDWDHPHFEKLIQIQAQDLRLFAEAYAFDHHPDDLAAAEKIHGYVRAFLTGPEGAFYVSQDADVHDGEAPEPYYALNEAHRRRLGVPRVDTHRYARENGWMIEALATLYGTTGDETALAEAERSARWVLANRAVPGGGFRHGENAEPLYLGDTLAMGRAFLALHAATADPDWLAHAEAAALFIRAKFATTDGKGFSTVAGNGVAGGSSPEFDENISLTRFANLLSHEVATPAVKEIAPLALRYAAAPEVARSRRSSVGGLLLAQAESRVDPLHVAIVGRRNDPVARRLYLAALALPFPYRQLEWLDPDRLGTFSYPRLGKAAAYLCTGRTCSSPAFDEDHLRRLAERSTDSASR